MFLSGFRIIFSPYSDENYLKLLSCMILYIVMGVVWIITRTSAPNKVATDCLCIQTNITKHKLSLSLSLFLT